MRGEVEAANAVGSITSEIQDERSKKRNAVIGGAALGGVTAGGVHHGVIRFATYHDLGADLYLFDGKVDVWDGDPVDVWGGDFLPEGNDADKEITSRDIIENAASFPDDITDLDIVRSRPPLNINLSIYDGPGWDLDPFGRRRHRPEPLW